MHREKVDALDAAEYWMANIAGVQNTLEALTGEWPFALDEGRYVTIYHGTYEQTFEF